MPRGRTLRQCSSGWRLRQAWAAESRRPSVPVRYLSGMATPRRPLVVYVDVDDTLIRSFGSKQIPMPSVVERVRALAREENVLLYCWSSGGAEYAREVATRLGLVGVFEGFLPKPNVLIDDLRMDAWRDLLTVHPNEAASLDGDYARERLGWG